MIYWLFLILFSPSVHAQEKVEKIKTTISPVIDRNESAIEVPKQIPYLEWDSKGIRLIRRDLGKQKFAVLLKGTLVKHQVESFTYQVDGYEAQKIKIRKNQFDLEIPLEKSPAIIRLWLEVSEGKGVRIYTDQLNIRSDLVPGAGEEKQISY